MLNSLSHTEEPISPGLGHGRLDPGNVKANAVILDSHGNVMTLSEGGYLDLFGTGILDDIVDQLDKLSP